MERRGISEALHKEAEKVLEEFRDGSRFFLDYEFGLVIPHRLEFYEWILDIGDYVDVDPIALEGKNRFETIKRFLPTVDVRRLEHLIANPKSITEAESLEWRRALYQDDQQEADFLVLVPLQLTSGEMGAAIIFCYSNIPDGDYDLNAVFESIEEGEQYLKRYCF